MYNFVFVGNVLHHTSPKTSRRDVEAPETLESLGSFKVSASVSEAAMSRLGQNFESLSLGSEGLVHIPANHINIISLQSIIINHNTHSL